MEQAIYGKLQAVARAHELTNYTKMGELVGLDPHDSRLWSMLDEINRFEHENKRPMISALVISKEENKPGSGFWVCASVDMPKLITEMQRFVQQLLLAVLDSPPTHPANS